MNTSMRFHSMRARAMNINHTKSSLAKHGTQFCLPFGFVTCQFLRNLDPLKLTVKTVVNRASTTIRSLSFPFCFRLPALKRLVQLVWGEKLHLGKLPIFFFLLLFWFPSPFVVIFESTCIWLLPFRLSLGCPRWRLACTCHATCAVAAAQNWRASFPSAPRTAAPRLHIHSRC